MSALLTNGESPGRDAEALNVRPAHKRVELAQATGPFRVIVKPRGGRRETHHFGRDRDAAFDYSARMAEIGPIYSILETRLDGRWVAVEAYVDYRIDDPDRVLDQIVTALDLGFVLGLSRVILGCECTRRLSRVAYVDGDEFAYVVSAHDPYCTGRAS